MPYVFSPVIRGLAGISMLVWLLICALPAHAHRVNIFAWLEGETVVVECGFSRSSPVKQGLLTVFDALNGEELLQGRTDDKGIFRFAVPQAAREGHGLRLVLTAGEGHANEWNMDAEEFAALSGHGYAAHTSAPVPKEQSVSAVTPTPQVASQPAVSLEALRQVVDSSLEARLGPIRRELAALNEAGPTVRDIVGGIGWIVGLVGIACYFRRR